MRAPPKLALFPYTPLFRSLKAEGFTRLPRRPDEDRPPSTHPLRADIADVGQLDLRPRTVHTKFGGLDRKSTRLNSSHANISYAVFCLKKKILYLILNILNI